MAGIPMDGVFPRPPEDEGPDIPRQQSHGVGGKIGGIFSTLLGIKHAREVAEKENYGNWALGILHKAATTGGVSPEQQQAAYKLIRGAFGDTAADIIQFHTKQANERIEMERKKAEEDRLKRALLDQGQQKPAYQGTFTPPMSAAAMAPASPAAQAPQPQPAPVMAPDQSGPGGPSATDSAVPYFLRPNAPAPGAAPPTPGPAAINTILQRKFPQPPFNSGVGMAGPAPIVRNPVEGRVSSAASGGVGFGGQTTTPYVDPEMQPEVNPLADFRQIGVNKAAMSAPLERFRTDENIRQSAGIAEQKAALERAEADRKVQLFMASDEWKQLTPRDRAFAILRIRGVEGALPNAMRPMNLPQSAIPIESVPEGALDLQGNPLPRTPGTWARVQQDPATNDLRYYLTQPKEAIKVEPDRGSPSGFSYVAVDPQGKEMFRRTAPPPGSQVVRETATDIYVQVGANVVKFPKITRAGPVPTGGMPLPPGGAGAGSADLTGPETIIPLGVRQDQPAPATGGVLPVGSKVPGGGVVVGTTTAEEAREQANPLTEAGQKTKSEILGRLGMMDYILKELETNKDDDTPFALFWPRLKYAGGVGGDMAGLISQLELSSILQGATALRGASKAMPALHKAMQHTPNPWIDSNKTMYDKLTEMKRNFNEALQAVEETEQRYPGGVKRTGGQQGGGTQTAPSGGKRPPLSSFERK